MSVQVWLQKMQDSPQPWTESCQLDCPSGDPALRVGHSQSACCIIMLAIFPARLAQAQLPQHTSNKLCTPNLVPSGWHNQLPWNPSPSGEAAVHWVWHATHLSIPFYPRRAIPLAPSIGHRFSCQLGHLVLDHQQPIIRATHVGAKEGPSQCGWCEAQQPALSQSLPSHHTPRCGAKDHVCQRICPICGAKRLPECGRCTMWAPKTPGICQEPGQRQCHVPPPLLDRFGRYAQWSVHADALEHIPEKTPHRVAA